MAQQNNKFTAFWMDTTTAPWTPLTGLSATINIRDVSGNLVVNNQPMTELWGGHYIYTFTGYNPAVDYVYDCNPWATAYIESWVTNNIEQLISEIRVWGGWSFNISGIQTTIRNSRDSLITEMDKRQSEIIKQFNETNSHIDVAKDDILNKIEGIEIPEAILEEKEAKKAIKLIQNVDKKLTGYIDTEMKEKEQLEAIAREFNRLELEDSIKEKEKEMEHKKMMEEKAKMEAEQDQKLLEEIKKEFDLQEEQEKEEKRKELEKELEEIEKEKQEIEKELKSI